MRVLVFGGRKYHDFNTVIGQLEQLQYHYGPITCIIHGDASGADRLGQRAAREHFLIPEKAYPADWKNLLAPGAVIKVNAYGQYNAHAGNDRNQRMVDEGRIDIAMGFPGGSGTADMLKRLIAAKIPVWNAGCA